MASPSPETQKSERTAMLRDTLDRNRKVCQELKEAVENCISKVPSPEQAAEEPSSG